MAQRERDPQRLALLIDEMNSLLDQHEKKQNEKLAVIEIENPSAGSSFDPDNVLKLDVNTWQYDA
jgi:hypothetical protein